MPPAKFPADLGDLTPERLESILREQQPDVRVKGFRVAERARCGDGIASTADRVALAIEYAEGHDAGLPAKLMLKTILLHRWLRFGLPAILALARTMNVLEKLPILGRHARPLTFRLINFYQRFFPHAPEAMYANEVRFYHELSADLDIEAPATYGSVFDAPTGQFGLILEDLRLRGAHFPNATETISPDHIRALVRTLARLHARNWQSPRLAEELAWVPTTSNGGMFPVFDAIGLDLIRDQVAKNAFKQRLIAPLDRSLDQMWEDTWKVQALFDHGPTTLCHGDSHIANTYLLPDGSAGLLDWQLMVRGLWAHDLTYLLVTALEPESRRASERELISYYLEQLAAEGVGVCPGREEAWLRHRQAAIWGLVIGWLITPPQNYGEAITAANIRKCVTAIQDLGSFDAVP